MHLFYSPDFNNTDLNFETTRKADAVALSLADRPIEGVTVVTPRRAIDDELGAVHSADYLTALRTGRPLTLASSNGIGWHSSLWRAVTASTGGVRDAALTALNEGVAGSLSSGLHHAHRRGGRGFCTLNGLALAAHCAVQAGAERILILDLDAHCGGGTANIIADMAEVEQVDVSVSSFDEYATVGRDDVILVLADGPTYLRQISEALSGIPDPRAIDLVIYNAGVDPHQQAGGVSGIDTTTLAEREAIVFDWCNFHNVPVAFVLAGGYTSPTFGLADVVDLHRLTIAAAATHSDLWTGRDRRVGSQWN